MSTRPWHRFGWAQASLASLVILYHLIIIGNLAVIWLAPFIRWLQQASLGNETARQQYYLFWQYWWLLQFHRLLAKLVAYLLGEWYHLLKHCRCFVSCSRISHSELSAIPSIGRKSNRNRFIVSRTILNTLRTGLVLSWAKHRRCISMFEFIAWIHSHQKENCLRPKRWLGLRVARNTKQP